MLSHNLESFTLPGWIPGSAVNDEMVLGILEMGEDQLAYVPKKAVAMTTSLYSPESGQ